MESSIYKIKFTNASFKDIERLDKKIREKIITDLTSLSRFPFDFKRDIKKLKGIGKNIYRLRVGELRVIYFLSNTELVVLRIIDRKDLLKIINTIKFN
jgi:mRNA-degrading endonuclease RelE of RelBE toxin-antitoxin system